ncbi:hypothetical protein HUN08_18095 [Gordonia sp. X0973]|uniref:hypothetical protein n=1 Tax=Gordonia sp. X0973 TaxID=2742602 RepID=UPI000F544D4C|nr:hypothetical protein [Gordonia sp. X0973]QKT08908.1 hypothetical protein HUN08_18095 [Gordonia sp. X0973]
MKQHRIAATAALLIAALGAGAATAQAAPTTASVKPVHYQVRSIAGGATVKIDNGSFTQNGRELNIRASNGQSVGQLPLTYQINNIARPLIATISGNTATLTAVRTGPGRIVTPVTRQISLADAKHKAAESFTPRDQQALAAFSNRSTIGSFVSAAVGAGIGAGIGCVVGALAGAIVTLPLATLLGGGPLAGCIAGALLGTFGGASAGLLLVGVPIILFSAFQYFSTVTSPCTAKGAYCQDPAHPKPEKKDGDKKNSSKQVHVTAA